MTGGRFDAAPLQYLARLRYGMGQPPPLSEDGVPILRATNISRGCITSANLQRARVDDLPLDRAPLLETGELLVVRSGAYTGDSALVTEQWAGSAPGYDLRVTPLSGVEPRFISWSLLSRYCLDQIDLLRTRAAQPHLNADELASIHVPRPPLEVQRRIADYLDTETARIDRLVRQNERAAALAEEAWQKVLSEVLFRSTGTPFKALPSGHPPGYRPLWLAARTFSGKTLQSAPMTTTDVEVQYLTAANITEGGVDLTGVREMWASEHERALLAVREGDVLVIEGGATAGRPALLKVQPPVTTILQNHVHCVRPQPGFHGDFLHWVLTAYYCSGWYGAYVAGVTFGSFPAAKLRGLLVPDLTYEQQRELSSELDERHDDVVRTQGRLREFSRLLHERRQALITAAVTGELEV